MGLRPVGFQRLGFRRAGGAAAGAASAETWVSPLIDFTVAPQSIVIPPPTSGSTSRSPILSHAWIVFDGVNDGAGTVSAGPKLHIGNNSASNLFDNFVRANTLASAVVQKPITDGAYYVVASYSPVDPASNPPPFVVPLAGNPITVVVANPATGTGLTCRMRVVLELSFV